MKKVERGLLLLGVFFWLQSCYYLFTDETPYSKFSHYDMVKALDELSTIQTEEYVETDKVSSSFELNVECYKSYSIIPKTQANIVINIATQSKRCVSGIIVIPYVHKIFLPKDARAGEEVIEVLCDTNGYRVTDIDSVAMEVGWVEEKPICPDDMIGTTVEPTYRRYPIGSDPSLRPEFKRWKWFTPRNTSDS